MRPLRFGVQALTLDWAQWQDVVAELERLPLSSLLFGDHLLEGFADPLAGAAAVAARTSRLRVGTMMLNVAARHPAVIAKGAATVAALSEQPFELGMGAGWLAAEAQAVGLPLGDPRTRIDRLEESLRIVRGLLGAPRTTVHGDHFRVVDAPPALEPPPARRP